jgi:hypothetical protein
VLPEPKKDWTGIGAGVGAGIGIPLLALFIIGPLLWRRRRRRSNAMAEKDYSPHDSASSGRTTQEPLVPMGKQDYPYELTGTQSYELDTVGERVELPVKNDAVELSGSGGERH